MDIKKEIKGFAKNTGRYTLKALAKGAELLGRGSVKMVDALVKNPVVQTIGTLGISAVVPEIGTKALMRAGKSLILDTVASTKDIKTKFRNAINMGNLVTRTVGNRIISPLMNRADKDIEKAGEEVQDKIDDMFK